MNDSLAKFAFENYSSPPTRHSRPQAALACLREAAKRNRNEGFTSQASQGTAMPRRVSESSSLSGDRLGLRADLGFTTFRI